jgi:hypothetical protein
MHPHDARAHKEIISLSWAKRRIGAMRPDGLPRLSCPLLRISA